MRHSHCEEMRPSTIHDVDSDLLYNLHASEFVNIVGEGCFDLK